MDRLGHVIQLVLLQNSAFKDLSVGNCPTLRILIRLSITRHSLQLVSLTFYQVKSLLNPLLGYR